MVADANLGFKPLTLQVSDNYDMAMRGMMSEEVTAYIPDIWTNMCEVKSAYYRALAHYYAAMGLLKQKGLLFGA